MEVKSSKTSRGVVLNHVQFYDNSIGRFPRRTGSTRIADFQERGIEQLVLFLFKSTFRVDPVRLLY